MSKEKKEVITTVRLDEKTHYELKKFCLEKNITMTQFFRDAVEDALSKGTESRYKNEDK